MVKVVHISNNFVHNKLYHKLIGNLGSFGIESFVFNFSYRKTRERFKSEIDYLHSDILLAYHKYFFHSRILTCSKELEDKIPWNIPECMFHAHTVMADGAIAFKIKMKYRTNYLVAVRNTDINYYYKFRPDLRSYFWKILKNASYIVFISPAYKKKVISICPKSIKEIILKKSIVIGNGISSFWLENGFSADDASNKSKLKKEKQNIIFVGGLDKNKNLSSLIKAVKQLNAVRAVKLTVVGEAPSSEASKPLDVLSINDPSIEYKGPVSNKRELLSLYRKADVLAVPSHFETFGLVYVEGWSQGLPCVHAVGQGIDGFFPNERISFSCDPNSEYSIKSALEAALNSTDENGAQCAQAAKLFDWRLIANQYSDLYASMGITDKKRFS